MDTTYRRVPSSIATYVPHPSPERVFLAIHPIDGEEASDGGDEGEGGGSANSRDSGDGSDNVSRKSTRSDGDGRGRRRSFDVAGGPASDGADANTSITMANATLA